MLKKRIIPLLLIKDFKLVKSVKFKHIKYIGNPENTAFSLYKQDADELVLLNISQNNIFNKKISIILTNIVRKCFIPITFGGGINNNENIKKIFETGVDKISLNSINYSNINILKKVSLSYGSQAAVCIIDYKIIANQIFLFSNNGKKKEKINFYEHIKKIIDNGASEIIFQNIDYDGTMNGCEYLNNIKLKHSDISCVILGGVGSYSHVKKIFENDDFEGIACGSLFSFTDSSPIRLKSYLKNNNIVA